MFGEKASHLCWYLRWCGKIFWRKVVPLPWGWGPKKQERLLPDWLMEALSRCLPFRAKVRTWAPPNGTDLGRQQWVVERSDILIPCPGIEPGYPGWEPGILARRLARARGWTLSFHGSLPPVKSAFITEAESVNAGTDFIIRNIAQVGEHRKKWFSWDRSKAEMQSWRERVWMSPPVSRSTVKSRSSHSYEAVLLDFAFLQAYHLVSFSTPDLPGTLPCIHTHIPQPRWISKWRFPWGARLIMVWHSPLTFDPQGALLRMSGVSLVPKDVGVEIPLSSTQTRFCPSLSLPWRLHLGIYKRQTLAIYAVSIVLFISESKQEADSKCLNCSWPIPCHRGY